MSASNRELKNSCNAGATLPKSAGKPLRRIDSRKMLMKTSISHHIISDAFKCLASFVLNY